jgi:WD40 repeat protein
VGSPKALGTRTASRALALSPDGSTVCAAGNDGVLHFYSLTNGSVSNVPVGVSYVVQTHYIDNTSIALLSNDGRIHIVNLANGNESSTLGLHGNIRSFDLNRSTHELAAGDEMGTIGIWNLASLNGNASKTSSVNGAISAINFSLDGKMLAAGTQKGAIYLWNTSSEQGQSLPKPQIATTTGEPIHAIAFSPNSTLLAAGSSDGKVRLWNPTRMAEIPITLADNSSWMWALAFSPDGSTLAASSADKSIHLIPVQPDAIVQQVQQKIGRNLTHKEWDEFIGSDVPYSETIPELRSEK